MPGARKNTGRNDDLTERYLEGLPCDLTFGQPFKFGSDLTFKRQRDQAEPISSAPWAKLSYMDPGLMWMPQGNTTLNYTQLGGQLVQGTPQPNGKKQAAVTVTVVDHRSRDACQGQEQIPPPATVTISSTRMRGVSGIDIGNRVKGVAVREATGIQKSSKPPAIASEVSVIEQINKQDVRKRLASLDANIPTTEGLRPTQRQRLQQYSALERVMHALAQQEQQAKDEASAKLRDETAKALPTTSSSLGGPAFTMGQRTRSGIDHKQSADSVPGPGQYEVERVLGGPTGPAFTLAGRIKPKSHEALPGPGQYEGPGTARSGPAFTFAGKAAGKVEELPGPGAYDLVRDIRTGPAVTIAGKARSTSPEPLPGPADYQSFQPAGRDAPAFTLYGRVEPPKPAAACVPAPGEYELPTSWRTGPAYSLAARPLPQVTRDASPGPGEYNSHLLNTSLNGPAYTIATRPPQPDRDESPGPGDYHTTLPASAPAFTMAGKPVTQDAELAEAALLPGPGQYNVLQHPCPGSPAAPAYTIAGRTAEPSLDDAPGPGSYNPDTYRDVGPAFTMAGRSSPGPEYDDLPGPGHYNDVTDSIRASAPAFTMGARPKPPADKEHDSPAPGDYEVTSMSSPRGPAYTIPQAGVLPSNIMEDAGPGPGQYNVRDSLPAGPAYTIPATGRDDTQRSPSPPSPAPGDYDVARTSLDGPAYTIAARPTESIPKDPSPGPGEYYSLKQASQNDQPAFTMQGKPLEKDVSSLVPGPGSYHPIDPASPSAPAYTIAGRHEAGPRNDDQVPGPGTYQEPASPRGPAYTMQGKPNDVKGRELGSDSPGPGAYPVPLDSPKGPAYTMAGKAKDPQQENEAPGPGQYPQPVMDKGPAWTIRGRANEPQTQQDGPGPADYQPPGSPAGPAYTMAGRYSKQEVLGDPDIPGPGMYGAPGQDLIGSNGPAYTFRPRHADSPTRDSPGPGAYQVHDPSQGPAFTLGAKLCVEAPSPGRDSPAPGQYGAPMPPGGEGPAYSMGERLAPAKLTSHDSPAPGDYGLPGDGRPAGPAYTLGDRRQELDPAMHVQGPGPGEYQRVLHPPTGPAYTLGKKLRDLLSLKKQQGGPDPGEYHLQLPVQGPAYTFASRAGAGPLSAGSPMAPGDYEVGGSGPSGAAYTLQGKHKERRPDMKPGPGQYDHYKKPPLSSILKTLPNTQRLEYAVTKFDAGGPAAHTTGGGRTRRRVSFSEGTQFRDSGEGSGGRHREQAQQNTISQPRGGHRTRSAPRQRTAKATVPQPTSANASSSQAAAFASQLVARYLSQPAGNTVSAHPPSAIQPKPTLQLAEPSPGIITAPEQKLRPSPQPLAVSYMSGAAGKPAVGLIKRQPRILTAQPAVVTRTGGAATTQQRSA